MKNARWAAWALCLGMSFSLWGCGRQAAEENPPEIPVVGAARPLSVQKEEPEQTEGEREQAQPERLTLEMEASYPLTSEALAYTIAVPEGEQAQVALAPQLERQTDQGWQPVECAAGFCGTPDCLDGRHQGELLTEWYPDLTAGTYRLSFRSWPEGSDWPEKESQFISAQFQLEE